MVFDVPFLNSMYLFCNFVYLPVPRYFDFGIIVGLKRGWALEHKPKPRIFVPVDGHGYKGKILFWDC